MKIPDDVYDRVFDLASGLVNASEAEDRRSYWRLRCEIRRYSIRRSHPGKLHRDPDPLLACDPQLAVELIGEVHDQVQAD